MSVKNGAFSALFCLLFTAGLQATEQNNEFDLFELSLEQLLTVEVLGAGILGSQLKQSPANVLIFDKQHLQRLQYHDLSELLPHIPGIDISDNNHWYGEHYTIRGIQGNDRFLVLINGKKLNVPSGFLLSVGNSISIQMAERVEVIYGASSVTFGSDAFSAVINIVTKSSDSSFVKVGAAAGDFATKELWLDAQYTVQNDVWLRAYFRQYISDGFNFPSREFDEAIARYPAPIAKEFEQPIDDYNLFFEWQWSKLSGGFFRQYFEEGNGRGFGQGNSPHLTILSKENKWNFVNDLYWLNWHEKIHNSEIEIEFKYHHYALGDEAKFFEFTDLTYTQPQAFFKTGVDDQITLSVKYGNQLNADWKLLLGVEHDWLRTIPPYANDLVFGSSSIPHNQSTDRRIKTTRFKEKRAAAFGELHYQFNEQLSTSVGLRYDYAELSDDTVNPRFSIIYQPDNDTVVKVIHGTSFQSPSLNFQYEQWGNEFYVMVPNSEQDFELKNQKVSSSEVIWLQQVNDDFLISVSAYYNRLDDLIGYQFLPSTFNQFAGAYTPGQRYQNTEQQESYGIDLGAKFNRDNFHYYFYYSYLEAKPVGQEIERRLVNTATHKVWGGVDFQIGDFTMALNAKWITDPYSHLSNNQEQQLKASGYFLLNAAPSYQLSKNWRLFAKVNNLLDSDIGHVGTSSLSLAEIPQPGINAMIGIEWTIN